MNIAQIELSDTSQFNALGEALAASLATALHCLTVSAAVAAIVLQARGPHFCIGANPNRAIVMTSLAALSHGLQSIAKCCCALRECDAPVLTSLHGHTIGGGVALFLNTDFAVSDALSTFQHGNLRRGTLA
jgi:enoyl-CoA hydratase/carnithine racemase